MQPSKNQSGEKQVPGFGLEGWVCLSMLIYLYLAETFQQILVCWPNACQLENFQTQQLHGMLFSQQWGCSLNVEQEKHKQSPLNQ